jgi:phosphate transport system substrate-binding protein
MRVFWTRGWRAAAVRAVIAICCSALVLTLTSSRAEAIGPTVNGAGSTWVFNALDQWRADIAAQGYSINYNRVGSSAGRSFYIINQVDFAATEIPFQPDEVAQLQAAHKSYQYVPDVAGGTSLMYNLHSPSGERIKNLRLDSVTAAKIFTGGISSWQDPAIQALNPGLQLRETSVVPVLRSDGSGTSAQFSLYLAAQAANQWNWFVSTHGCPAPCSQWPQFGGSVQQNGSDSVANFVANDALGSGGIGYVEASYAFGRYFPVAGLKNASGNFAQPTAENVAQALTHNKLHADLTQDLTDVYAAPEANSYPMSSYSYMVTPTANFDPAKGNVLGTWLIYIACGGQRKAAPLGYSPLPPNLVAAVFDAVRRIPGAPTPPPIDKDHCPNPTVVNPGSFPTGPGGGGTTTGGGTSTTSASGGAAAATSGSTSADAGSSPADAAAVDQSQAEGAADAMVDPAVAAAEEAAGILDTATGGSASLPSRARMKVLSETQRKALVDAAVVSVAKAKLPDVFKTEFVLGALLILVVFAPMFFGWQPIPAQEEDQW